MKRICSVFLLAALLMLSLCACSSGRTYGSGTKKSDAMPNKVCITVKDYGKIIVELYPEHAPMAVSNFKGLVHQGYYTNLTFHRIIEGFMIQGGGGKNVPSIKGEFAENGIENNLKHVRGTVSMARTNDPNSASSQFFICQDTYAYGDGKYAAFGKVLEGMAVVDAIAAVPTNYYNNAPLTDVVIESIVFVEE